MVWLSDEVDLARGDVLLNRDSRLEASSSLNVNIAWLDRDAFNPKKNIFFDKELPRHSQN